MARAKVQKRQPSLEDALKALQTIHAGLDGVLTAAEDLVPSLGEGLSGLLGKRLSILAEGGRAGLEIARREVGVGAKILQRLVTEIGKLSGERGSAVSKAAPVRKAKGSRRRPGRPKMGKAAAPARKRRQARAKKAGGPSLGDELSSVMKDAKRSMMAAELAKILKEKGYKSAAKNFRAVVQVTLSKDRRFKRDPKGGYRLA